MVSIANVIKNIVKQLLNNPIYLMVFTIWIITVASELSYLETKPIDWIKDNIDKTNPAGKHIEKLSDSIKNNIHKVLIISGLFINIFFCKNAEKIKLINVILVIITVIVKIDLSLFTKFILIIVTEFFYCMIRDPEQKFYILLIAGTIFYFEDSLKINDKQNENLKKP